MPRATAQRWPATSATSRDHASPVGVVLGIPRQDVVYAILHANYVQVLEHESVDKGRIKLYIGHSHVQTDREIQILVHEFPESGEEAQTFYVDNLAARFKRSRRGKPLMTSPTDYDRLATDLTDPSVPLPEGLGRALTGHAAAAEGQAFLLREYGSPEAVEAAMRPGRPSLRARTIGSAPKQGSSPIVKGRVPAEYVVAIKELEKRTGNQCLRLNPPTADWGLTSIGMVVSANRVEGDAETITDLIEVVTSSPEQFAHATQRA